MPPLYRLATWQSLFGTRFAESPSNRLTTFEPGVQRYLVPGRRPPARSSTERRRRRPVCPLARPGCWVMGRASSCKLATLVSPITPEYYSFAICEAYLSRRGGDSSSLKPLRPVEKQLPMIAATRKNAILVRRSARKRLIFLTPLQRKTSTAGIGDLFKFRLHHDPSVPASYDRPSPPPKGSESERGPNSHFRRLGSRHIYSQLALSHTITVSQAHVRTGDTSHRTSDARILQPSILANRIGETRSQFPRSTGTV